MKPLAELKVVDLTRILSGPFCTMMLSDMGADVIKVEPPGSGDDSRGNPPFVDGVSFYFLSLNRGKKNISIDLKNEQGKALLLKMVSEADVLVENFKPGTMEKLGLGYDEVLSKVNPRLIYCAISGFGKTGPYRNRPAYDIVVQAMGGIMSITGQPGGIPTRVGASIGDVTAGLFATSGILAALRARDRDGKGQAIDISMLDCQVAICEGAIARYFGTGIVPRPIGNRHPTCTPFDVFQTEDESMVIAIQKNSMWEKFCHAIDAEKLVREPLFETNAKRCENEEALKKILQPILLKKTSKEWEKIFISAGVACGPINTIEDIVNDPHILARDMIVEVKGHKKLGTVKYPGIPIKFSKTKCSIDFPAPVLGQYSDEILRKFNYSEEEIAALRANGVVK